MKRVAISGAIIGAVIPLGFWFAYFFFNYMSDWKIDILWPSWIVLMSLETQKSLAIAIVVWVGAALVNVALYTLLAIFGYAFYRLVQRIIHHSGRTL